MQLELFKCNGPKADNCQGACCYIKDKEVTSSEFNTLRHSTIKRDGSFYLINDELTGACVNLREGSCSVYKIRPQVCRDYESCEGDRRIQGYITIIQTQDLSLAREVLEHWRDVAKSSSDPDSLIDLMFQ
jgi:Fe-S-cluster containining protein